MDMKCNHQEVEAVIILFERKGAILLLFQSTKQLSECRYVEIVKALIEQEEKNRENN